MDNLFEVIIAVVFIVFSVLSEMAKKKKDDGTAGKSDSSGADLSAIEEFFRKQAEDQQSPSSSKPSDWSDTHAGSMSSSAAFPPPPPTLSSEGDGDFVQSAKKKNKKKKRPALHEESDASRTESVLTKRKPFASRGEAEHINDEGPCLDEAKTLTGETDYENAAFGSLVTAGTSARSAAPLQKRARFPWSRRDIMRAVVFNELMTRYDLNRIYSRIPDQRRIP